MQKPKTNAEALALVIDTVGSKTALAKGVGVTKQLTSRWKEIPPSYLEATCKLTKLSPEYVLPEMVQGVHDILEHGWREPAAVILPDLIRVILQPKASPWHDRKKRKPRKS